MSRYTKQLPEEKRLVYGWDHALGYFYEIWDLTSDPDSPPLKDRCSMFGMSRNEMAEVLIESKANRDHIQKLALDVPF
jgi:hypothetical protein